jgi:hypothetical protein
MECVSNQLGIAVLERGLKICRDIFLGFEMILGPPRQRFDTVRHTGYPITFSARSAASVALS